MVLFMMGSARISSRAGFIVGKMSTEEFLKRRQELADVTLVLKDACKKKSR